MRLFSGSSIKRKTTLLVMLVSCLSLLVAGTIFIIYDRITMKETMVHNLAIQADMVGNSSTAAILFDSEIDAQQALSALRAQPVVMAMSVYRVDSSLFATYARRGYSDYHPPVRLDRSHVFDRSKLSLFRPIVLDGEQIGTVYAEMDLTALDLRLRRIVMAVMVVMVVSMALAFVLAARLQKLISRPVVDLANVAMEVSRRRDYSLRATPTSGDEVSLLVNKFNEMLSQIQQRDVALQAAHDGLELRVAERTVELEAEITERKLIEQERIRRLQRLRRQQEAVVRLVTDPAVAAGDLQRVARTACELAAEAVNVAFAGVWFFSETREYLRCFAQYDRTRQEHRAGFSVNSADYPRYVKALESGRAVAANDARMDPRTSEFTVGYLDERGITSMLDAAIRVSGEVVGVVCLEHVGQTRIWTHDEITFAGEITDQIAQVLINRERLQAQEALKESESKYRTLFDSANDSIFLMQQDRFVDCNARTEHMFGCTRDQILGQPPYVVSPEFQPDGRSSKEAAMERINSALDGATQSFEWQHSRLDGSLFETEVGLNRMVLGNQVMLLAIVRDITERKQTELERARLQEKLERAERMESLGVLAGGVAHDLNNMLGPLVGYPELIERKLDSDSPIRKQVQRMGKAAKDAADVIQDLLTLARRGRYEMQSTSLNEVV
ncbi:MAG: PAS domain S-box protein, partial [bacterium]